MLVAAFTIFLVFYDLVQKDAMMQLGNHEKTINSVIVLYLQIWDNPAPIQATDATHD